MSHERISFDSELSAIEAALQLLAPAESRVDRDAVMFRSGQAAARAVVGWHRAWIVTAASLGLIAMAEAFLLAHRPAPRTVERVVVVREAAKPQVEAPAPARAVADTPAAPVSRSSEGMLALGRTDYERLAEQVLRYGLDGLPAPAATVWRTSEPKSAASRQSLQEELRRVLDLGDHS
jgi:hypothetical protein